MICSFQKNKALTLTELLISSALIAVIMLGVTSFALSVKANHDTTNKLSHLSMQTTAAMAMIKKDAAQAIGDRNNPAVLYKAETTGGVPGAVICFREDADDNPASYAGDEWYCYTQGTSRDLHRCGPITNAENPLLTGSSWFSNMPTSCEDTLNSLLPMTTNISGTWVSLQNDVNGNLKYIDIKLESLYDRNQAENSLTNPKVELSAHISPMGMSRQ